MKDSNRRDFEACKRDVKWSVDFSTFVPVGSMLATKFAALSAMVDSIEAKASAQAFAVGETGEEFEQKDDARRTLRTKVANVSDAAVAAEPDHPGIQEVFRFRRNMSDADLLATARAFVLREGEFGDIISEFCGNATWAPELTIAANGFEAATDDASGALGSRAAAVAEINQDVAAAMQIKRTLDKMVPLFVSDTGALAAWAVATHVERAPKKPKPPTPPTP
ncbi:MAG TPA: hypothetical protein PKA82_13130 [Pyrinomonadaceae bacterium]|nr:hypothetical protein [Pyrinomonadaceae bacterium]